MDTKRPDIAELLKLARSIKRIFGNIDLHQLSKDEKFAVIAAAADVESSAKEVLNVQS